MEVSFLILCRCRTANDADAVARNLSAERPIFEDEVAAEERFIFRALEYVEEPEHISRPDETTFQMTFMLRELDFDEEAEELSENLHKAGVERLLGYLWADEYQRLIAVVDGELSDIEDWDRRALAESDGDPEEEFAVLATLQEKVFR